jgi:hypothetical protein
LLMLKNCLYRLLYVSHFYYEICDWMMYDLWIVELKLICSMNAIG